MILNNGTAQWFNGIPWYLTDLRPQGFLGRAWGKRLAQQTGLPEDISPAFRELCREMSLQLDTVEAGVKRLA